jgi:aminotransferase
MAQIDGMRDRTVVVNSMSKTYSVTGWRVGYCIAPPEITSAIRKVHDFLTVGAAAPLQAAGAYALSLPQEYYDTLQTEYRARRDLLLPSLEAAGFKTFVPDGAYYIMTDISAFDFSDDVEFTKRVCQVRVFTASRRWANSKCGSVFAKRTRRYSRPQIDCRS